VHVVFCELEHLIGSSGGVDSTITEEKISTRIEMKDLCEKPFNMVEDFETSIFV
jgi:hypothetical protein